MAEINLHKHANKIILIEQACGVKIIAPLTTTSDERYPYAVANFSYTEDGKFYSSSSGHSFDIVSVCGLDEFTLLKWITDRQPTEKDALHGSIVQVMDTSGSVELRNWRTVYNDAPWAHCPGWKPPEPDPRQAQVAQQLAELDAMRRSLNALNTRLEEMRLGLDAEARGGGNG